MKVVNKAASTVLSLMFFGSSVFAQSLADAKKAIDAEQYQKAKGLLKNLTVTQSTKDENYFYLGLVYIEQEYLDSAKTSFNKGLGVNPKSALNNVGLGMLERLDKNAPNAKSYFDKAILLAGKDDKPYVYVAKAYLLQTPNIKADPDPAIAVLEKAKVLGPKDPEVFTTLGLAYRYKQDSNNAYVSYNTAQGLDPKSPVVAVGLGVLWKFANNFEDANKQFQLALTMDPNYGPAYRELAESDYLQARNDIKVASVKVKEAVGYYKKYLDLTDRSVESRLRYADFLISAGDYKTLQDEANALAQSDKTNLRVYRYLAYAAYENGNNAAGLEAMNKWMKNADPKRIIPRDYLYMGRLQIKGGQDSLGILTLKRALDIDTTQVDLYGEIANALYVKKKYIPAAAAFETYIKKSRNIKLTDYVNLGRSYFFAYSDQEDAKLKTKVNPDTSLLTKADSALRYVNHKLKTPNLSVLLLRASVADAREADREKNYKGYAKPIYEEYVGLVAPTNPTDDRTKKSLVNAYNYLGYYYEFVVKDEAKAAENFGKSKDLDPANEQALNYFKRHGGTSPKGK